MSKTSFELFFLKNVFHSKLEKRYFYKQLMFLFLLQMLKYVGNSGTNEQQNAAKDMIVPSNGSPTSGDLITQIVITDTEVQHSGTYKCEPGDAPAAKVQVHVLDGETIIRLRILSH